MFATPFIKTTLLQVLGALTAIAAASSACHPKLWVVSSASSETQA
jgi:hypothetical protein